MKKIKQFINVDLINDFINASEDELKIDRKIASSFMKKIYSEATKGNSILIIGDFDVDGLFATIQLQQYIKLLEARIRDVPIDSSLVETYYTKRQHGYEMPEAIFNELSLKHDFIVFLDTGASYKYFNKETKNVLVIDHHPNTRDNLDFIYNPNKEGGVSTSTGKIVYDIIESFENEMRDYYGKSRIKQHDIMNINKMLAGVTLCSDMAEMSFENKTFLKESLDLMSSNKKNIAWLNSIDSRDISSLDLSFNIINKINSYSRLGKDFKDIEDIFKVGLDMYKTKHLVSSKKTYQLFNQLNDNHNLRKKITAKLDATINSSLKENRVSEKNVLAVKIENEYSGINGLLSQNILNSTSKSNVVISFDKNRGCYVGSGRGKLIKKAILQIMEENKLLGDNIKMGGHEMACGLSIASGYEDDFIEKIQSINISNNNSKEQEKFYYARGVREYKESVDYYNNLSPTTNMQERYYAIIDNYKNLGIIEKNNAWYCSTIKDKSDCITLYFKEEDIETIKSNSPIMLEITNQVNQNYFIEHKEVENKLFKYLNEIKDEEETTVELPEESVSIGSLLAV